MAGPSAPTGAGASLPEPPELPLLTAPQRRALAGVVDGLLPPLLVPPRHDDASTGTVAHRAFYEARLAADPAFAAALEDVLCRELPAPDRAALRSLLALLATRAGTALLRLPLAGAARFPTAAFADWPVPRQAALLSALQHARHRAHRRLFRLLQDWVLRTAFTYLGAPGGGDAGRRSAPALENPHFAAMGYAAAPAGLSQLLAEHWNPMAAASQSAAPYFPPPPSLAALYQQGLVPRAALLPRLDGARAASRRARTGAAPHNATDGTDAPVPPPAKTLVRIDCDVLVVGSGPAGAVAASVLAKAGYQVLVVEQGAAYGHDHLEPGPDGGDAPAEPGAAVRGGARAPFAFSEEGRALRYAYGGAARAGGTARCAPVLLAGAALGGGSTIGYGACAPLGDTVWREWLGAVLTGGAADRGPSESGGPAAAGTLLLDEAGQRLQDEYAAALEFVTHKLGLPTPPRRSPSGAAAPPLPSSANQAAQGPHNGANLRLLQACDGMGYPWRAPWQAYGDKGDMAAGYYSSLAGDRAGNKKTAPSVFLNEAAKFKAKVLDRCRVDRLVLSRRPDKTSERPRVLGAECSLGSDVALKIFARRAVVVGAGALHSPGLLEKSALRNRHLGRHLKLNPTTTVFGFMDAPVDAFLGLPQTVACGEFERGPRQDGCGATILCQNLHPGLLASSLAWTTPFEYKERLRRYRRILPLAVQQRDAGEGRVTTGLDGCTPVVTYRLGAADRASMTQAVQGAVKLLAMAGAREIVTGHVRDPGLLLGPGRRDVIQVAGDHRLQRYLELIPRLGMKPYDIPLFSTYQTGTCRMSSSPMDGVVDTNGESWEVDNLFVMDSSIFPTSPGVNPMFTIMVLAKILGSRLSMRLRYEDKQPMSVAETARAKALLNARNDARSAFHPLAGCRATVADVLKHLLIWVAVILVFIPLIFKAAPAPEVEIPVELPPSFVGEFFWSPLRVARSAWREAADFLTFW